MASKSHSTRTSYTLLPFALLTKSSRLSKNYARRSPTLLFNKNKLSHILVEVQSFCMKYFPSVSKVM